MTDSQKKAKRKLAERVASRCREVDVSYPEWVRHALHGAKKKPAAK